MLDNKISDLTLKNLAISEELSHERASFAQFRVISYGVGAVLLGATAYAVILR